MFKLFVEGGYIGMSVMTVELICVLFAAWKAPAWVKEFGLLALISGIFYQLLGLVQILEIYRTTADIPFGVAAGGLRVTLISTMYGLLIYAVSLVIRIVQKPRI